jgi:hypothetical protein
MYRSFAQLREGWTKNLALLFPAPVRLAVQRALEFVLILASFAIALVGAVRQYWLPAPRVPHISPLLRDVGLYMAATLAVILYALFLQRIRRAHFPWDANLLALFGLPLFSYVLLRSTIFHARSRVPWKGRTYSEQLCAEEPGKELITTPHHPVTGN